MNNDEEKNDSNESPYSDSIELFDTIFSEKQFEKLKNKSDSSEESGKKSVSGKVKAKPKPESSSKPSLKDSRGNIKHGTPSDGKEKKKVQSGKKIPTDKHIIQKNQTTPMTEKGGGEVKENQDPFDSQEMFDSIFKEEPESKQIKRQDDSALGIDAKFDAAFAEDITSNEKPASPIIKKPQTTLTKTAVSNQKRISKPRPQAIKSTSEKKKVPTSIEKTMNEKVLPAREPEKKIQSDSVPVENPPPSKQIRMPDTKDTKVQTEKSNAEKKISNFDGSLLKEKTSFKPEKATKNTGSVAKGKEIGLTLEKRKKKRVAFITGILVLAFIIIGGAYYLIRFEFYKKTLLPDNAPVVRSDSGKKAQPEAQKNTDNISSTSIETNKSKETPAEIQIEAGSKNIPHTEQKPEQEKNPKTEEIKVDDIQQYPYSIYLGSYKKLEDVRKAALGYSTYGISLYWVKVDLGDKGIWHRLFGGYFETREAADRFILDHKIEGAESKNTEYALLIKSLDAIKDINSMIQMLNEKGFSSYIIKGDNGEAMLYSGVFYQESRAREFKAELELNGIQCDVVKR